MSWKTDACASSAEVLAKKFQKRGMNFYHVQTKEEAKEKILSLIPEGSSVTWGGSVSMEEAGVTEAIINGNYEFIDRGNFSSPEEKRALYGKIVCSDYFLMSTNAFTADGELVNIDGASNRVACLAHGPQHVIVLASMNKLCQNTEDAIRRIRLHACPPNALRVHADTPCARTGFCADCTSDDCICCQIMITRFSRIKGRITVILTDEELGF
ncbi:MAG TPA: lactate utilization protein [Candidatus Blautia avistercoris]|mgnify:CR=1 FL=1|nr:lactate utilization protein [Candidatus Blautia avistercoris]